MLRAAHPFALLTAATALSCQRVQTSMARPYRTAHPGGVVMAGRTDGESIVEASASANVLRWEADATATEPCGPGMPSFLAEAASTDLVLRMDESVVGCQGESPAAPCGARAC